MSQTTAEAGSVPRLLTALLRQAILAGDEHLFFLGDCSMSYEMIHGWLKASPFVPFCVVTSSGERYEIRHPKMAFITKPQLYVALPDPDGIPARVKMIATLHVTALEPIDSGSAA